MAGGVKRYQWAAPFGWGTGIKSAGSILACLSLFVLSALLSMLFTTPVYRHGQECAICRLSRDTTDCLGQKRAAYQQTDCSRWYAANVEPSHAHYWLGTDNGRYCNLLGMTGGMVSMCGPRPAIQRLRPSEQLQAYAHFRDPLEAKRLFEDLAHSASHEELRRDDDIAEAIHDWNKAGNPGTWAEWIEWWDLLDGSSFDDWRSYREAAVP